jgi:hypothetical protein
MSDEAHLLARLDRLEDKVDILIERTTRTEVVKGAFVVFLSMLISIVITVGGSVLSSKAQATVQPPDQSLTDTE